MWNFNLFVSKVIYFAKTVVEKVGSDDGATRLPEEYRELEKVLCVQCHDVWATLLNNY